MDRLNPGGRGLGFKTYRGDVQNAEGFSTHWAPNLGYYSARRQYAPAISRRNTGGDPSLRPNREPLPPRLYPGQTPEQLSPPRLYPGQESAPPPEHVSAIVNHPAFQQALQDVLANHVARGGFNPGATGPTSPFFGGMRGI